MNENQERTREGSTVIKKQHKRRVKLGKRVVREVIEGRQRGRRKDR